MKKIYVFDFDKTILSFDCEEFIFEELDIPNLMDLNSGFHSVAEFVAFLTQKLFNLEYLDSILAKIRIDQEMITLLQSLKSQRLILLTDSCVYFVEKILQENGLHNIFEKIVGNPLILDSKTQTLKFGEVLSHDCSSIHCRENMCKTNELKKIVGNIKVIYIGDNDWCPCFNSDLVTHAFVREHEVLHQIINHEPLKISNLRKLIESKLEPTKRKIQKIEPNNCPVILWNYQNLSEKLKNLF